ncbi:MAG: hypothetical protein HYV16_06370 [Gammaproteobacteria bacterium]|nr:hypothetical protein [Gammaproteobacteria bacterium]
MSLEARFLAYALSLAAASALLAALLAQSLPLWLALGLSWLAVFALGTLWLRRCTAPLNRVLEGLNNGLDGFLDRDYSLSLAIARRDELGELVARYNRVGEALRAERQQIHQRELLLESILETNPAATVLVVEPDTVLFANAAARELLNQGQRLERKAWSALLAQCVEPLREALERGEDSLFSLGGDQGQEFYHVSLRRLSLNGLPHRLILIRPLTRELNRQEVAVWKKLIRLISHELNNSLAPIASLSHSGRLILERGGDPAPLHRVFDTIAARAQHLTDFIAGYVRFARLPAPRPASFAWAELLARLQALEPELVLALPEGGPGSGWGDAAQLEQMLLNLVKNAREAAGDGPVELTLRRETGGDRLSVLDRGPGMSTEQLERALLPFYSTKHGGTGLGLPLCREIVEAHGGRLQLGNREGGGLAASLWLPGRPGAA